MKTFKFQITKLSDPPNVGGMQVYPEVFVGERKMKKTGKDTNAGWILKVEESAVTQERIRLVIKLYGKSADPEQKDKCIGEVNKFLYELLDDNSGECELPLEEGSVLTSTGTLEFSYSFEACKRPLWEKILIGTGKVGKVLFGPVVVPAICYSFKEQVFGEDADT